MLTQAAQTHCDLMKWSGEPCPLSRKVNPSQWKRCCQEQMEKLQLQALTVHSRSDMMNAQQPLAT